jgi:hypothetical protein
MKHQCSILKHTETKMGYKKNVFRDEQQLPRRHSQAGKNFLVEISRTRGNGNPEIRRTGSMIP